MHEIYLSIQGESTHAGLPCVFLRTTGCPLRCTWCDTEPAPSGGTVMTVEELVGRVGEYDAPLVEVTGGEPLAQKGIHSLMRELADRGRTVLLETSGALDIGGVDPRVHVIMDVKCPGSDMNRRMRWENMALLKPGDEVKFVVSGREDYDYARRKIGEYDLPGRCEVLLSTVFGSIDAGTVVDWMLQDRLPVRFQLQMHKYVWPPDTRGV